MHLTIHHNKFKLKEQNMSKTLQPALRQPLVSGCLFRGIKDDISNPCWLFGTLHIRKDSFGTVYTIEHEVGEYTYVQNSVISSTIGQNTGLKDINGNDIYGGDIVIWNDGGGECELNPSKGWIRKAIVNVFPSICFVLTDDTPSGQAGYVFNYGNFIYQETEKHLKVIGNIHDNQITRRFNPEKQAKIINLSNQLFGGSL